MLPGRSYLMRIGTKYVPGARHEPQAQGRRQHAGAHRGEDARAERDRPVQPRDRGAGRVRSVRREPRDRRVHPHRPLHQRDRRRRHDHLRPAPRDQHPPPEPAGRQGARASRLQRAQARASSGSPACRARARARSPTSWSGAARRAASHTYLLDGDNVRHGLNRDLGFTDADRVENVRRVGEVARLFVDAGMIVLCSFISPFRAERRMVRELVRSGRVHRGVRRYAARGVHAPRSEGALRARARRARSRTSPAFDSPYEAPEAADIVVRTSEMTAEAAAERIVEELRKRGIIL